MENRVSLIYYVVDVFANKSYSGNPLSVVFTSGNLAPNQYVQIAREFGYSETSFTYYSIEQNALNIRSFTPSGFEVHGAGHNLLGAVCAAVLKGIDVFQEQGTDTFVIMKDAAIPVSVSFDNPDRLPAVKMHQRPAVIGKTVPVDLIAAALGLTTKELVFQQLVPTIVKTEVSHLMVPMMSAGSLNNIKPDNKKLLELSKQYAFEGFYCFVFNEPASQYIVESRFFNPLIGIDEDAATGTAAGPLAGFLVSNNLIKANNTYQIMQGVQLNQPSAIEVVVRDKDILVGGASVITMKGEIFL